MLRIWDAVQSWRVEKSSRKLYWCRAGPACLHINVFIPGDESKECKQLHPPVHSEGFRQPPRCRDVWAFWQELSTDEYDRLDRIVETKNYGDLLAFVLERVSLLLDHYVRSLFLETAMQVSWIDSSYFLVTDNGLHVFTICMPPCQLLSEQ